MKLFQYNPCYGQRPQAKLKIKNARPSRRADFKLVIVESPPRPEPSPDFLGSEYQIESSYGHVRDLPRSKLGIDTANNFEPSYIIPVKARKRVGELKKLVAKATEIILASDEDREGEAIAWHIANILNVPNAKRIVFHEITKSAINEALEHPRNGYELG